MARSWRIAVRGGLALVALACLIRVAGGTTPGETAVAARHAAGKVASVDDYMAFGFWYGCLLSGLASVVLLVTSRWWLDTVAVEEKSLAVEDVNPLGRSTFLKALLVTLVLAAVPRVARMRHSFWGDEDWAYRDLIAGRFSEAEDGSLQFKRHPWKVTAFWDKGTNNQYAYTLLARACHDGWKKLTGAEPQEFREWVLRVPSLAAGLGSIAMGALLLRRLGFGRAGIVFAMLLAIHPWHLRYSSEARGYTMLLFFLLAGIYFLLAALGGGRWRDWLMFALFEFLALYTWKAAVHPVAALNLGVFIILLVQRRNEAAQFWRWLVVNLGVLMAFVPLFAPAIPQIRRKLAVSTQAHGEMGLAWFKNEAAQLVGGADWADLGGVMTMIVTVAGLGSMMLGWWQMRARLGWVLLVMPVVGAILAFFHFKLTGNELLKWYVFYTLPFLVIFLAAGLAVMRRYTVGIFFVFYLVATGLVLASRAMDPLQPSRMAAMTTRNADEGTLHMGPSEIVTVGLFRVSQSYDPRMRQGRDLRSGDALMAVVDECRANGKPLRVSASNLGFARKVHADFLEVLEDESVFRKTGTFHAAERYLDIGTWEMVGD